MTTKNAENSEKPQAAVASSGWFCRLHRWSIRRDISRALKCCQQAKLGAYAHSEKAADCLIEAEAYLRSARALLRQNERGQARREQSKT